MTEIRPYVFPASGQELRTLLLDGEPWFVAADACRVLDLDVSAAMRRLDPDEYQQVAPTLISNQGIGPLRNVVSESGLYSLILGSRKPEAKAFKRWVTHDVLPAIRKTGRYEGQPLDELEVARRYVAALEAQRALEVEVAVQRARLDRAEPRAAYVDRHVDGAGDAAQVRVVAQQLGVPERRFREWMLTRDLIYRVADGQGGWIYRPRAQLGPRRHWFVVRDQPEAPRLHNGQLRTTLYVTPAGKVGLADLLVKHPIGVAA